MANQTFKEYLVELMVDVDPSDPAATMGKVKQAGRDPATFAKKQEPSSVHKKSEMRQYNNDPLKSEKLRLAKMQQAASAQEKRVTQKAETMAKRGGLV